MEHEVLSDSAIQEILCQAMEDQFSKARPATRHFFEHTVPDDDQDLTVTIHSWVIAKLRPTDTHKVVHYLANQAVKEVVATAAAVTGEIVFRIPNLLPHCPIWTDGAPLFAAYAPADGSDRFGVRGGNILKSANCYARDVRTATERLVELDPSYERDERLQLFCAKPLEKKLIRACAKAKVACRVFGVYNFKEQRSWVLTRDASACSLLIGRPEFDIPVEGSNIVVGARFVVWINDPKLAVCVTPKETA